MTAAPERLAVALAARYRIERVLGAGGMAVASFPGRKTKRLISSGGGTEPRWSRDGRELFWLNGGKLMAAPVLPGAPFHVGSPRALFPVEGYRRARNHPQCDVAPAGRFVMIREAPVALGAVSVEHWFAELTAKLAR